MRDISASVPSQFGTILVEALRNPLIRVDPTREAPHTGGVMTFARAFMPAPAARLAGDACPRPWRGAIGERQ